jgi:hypothetical protein
MTGKFGTLELEERSTQQTDDTRVETQIPMGKVHAIQLPANSKMHNSQEKYRLFGQTSYHRKSVRR